MVGEDRIVMRGSELRRVHVIRQVVARQLTQQEASEALGLTPRHIRRLRDRWRGEGDPGLAHRGRGQPSNRRKPVAFRRQVLALYARHYGDFGPTLAVEQVARHHGLTLSDETLRRWLRAQGIDHVAGIATLAEANRFLPAWLAQYNRRFAVQPAHRTDLHRPLPAGIEVGAVFALKTRRVLRRDRTVTHGGQLYQVQNRVRATQVVVEERVDGTLRILHHGRSLTYQPILHRPRPVLTPRPAPRRPRPLVKPPAHHPWNRFGTFARTRPREAIR